MKWIWNWLWKYNKNSIEFQFFIIYDDIKFTNIAKESIKGFDIVVDDLENKELVVLSVAASNKIETCIAPVDQLVLLPLDKVAELGGAADDRALNILHQTNTILLADLCSVELGKSGFALSVKKNKSVNHFSLCFLFSIPLLLFLISFSFSRSGLNLSFFLSFSSFFSLFVFFVSCFFILCAFFPSFFFPFCLYFFLFDFLLFSIIFQIKRKMIT